MQFENVLRTWKAFFEREGIRYAVIGGLAMSAWGSPRANPRRAYRDMHDVMVLLRQPGVDRRFIRTTLSGKVCWTSLMKSTSWFDAANFELPEPTPEDIAALERADEASARLSPEEYLRFLEIITRDLPPSRERDIPPSDPFEL